MGARIASKLAGVRMLSEYVDASDSKEEDRW